VGPVADADRAQLIRALFEENDRSLNGWLAQCGTNANQIIAQRQASGYGYKTSPTAIENLCLEIYKESKEQPSGDKLASAIRARFKRMEKAADKQAKAAAKREADSGCACCCCAANRIFSEPAWDMDDTAGARLFVRA
jgi:hypothetical protein